MDTRLITFYTKSDHAMTFRGPIFPERWNQILNPLSDSTRRAMEKSIGDQFFNNAYSYRTNGGVIGQFIALSIFVGKSKDDIIKVAREVFVEDHLGGLEKMVHCIDHNLTIPYPKLTMQTDIEELDKIPQSQRIAMITFKDEERFDTLWPEMARNIEFLFREVLDEEIETSWLLNYWREEGFDIPECLDNSSPANLHIMAPEIPRCTRRNKKDLEEVECVVVMIRGDSAWKCTVVQKNSE